MAIYKNGTIIFEDGTALAAKIEFWGINERLEIVAEYAADPLPRDQEALSPEQDLELTKQQVIEIADLVIELWKKVKDKMSGTTTQSSK